jgi:hypothetical protein
MWQYCRTWAGPACSEIAVKLHFDKASRIALLRAERRIFPQTILQVCLGMAHVRA